MLTVYAGLPGSGAQGRLIESLGMAVRARHTTLLVVPTEAEAVRARRALAASIPVGLRVVTMHALLEAEWAISGDGRHIAKGLQREILLSRALVSTGGSVPAGHGAISLLGTIAARAAAVGARDPAPSSGVSGGLTAALSSYERLLIEHELIEPASVALELVGRLPPSQAVCVDGFFEFDPAQADLLLGWAASGSLVTLTLPWSEGIAATAAVTPLVTRLKENGARIVDLGGPRDGRPDELARIATDLFTGTRPRAGDGCVRLGVACGAEGEARLMARLVKEKTVTGVAPERIAIALPDAREDLTWLLRALAEAGIETALDVQVPVAETAMGRALLHFWSFCRAGMAREDWVAFLRTPFSGIPLRRVDIVDITWRRSGISCGGALLRPVPELKGTVAACRECAGRSVGARTAKIWHNLVDRFLASAHPGMAPVSDADGALDAAVHRSFMMLLEQAASLGEGEVSADELWAAFAASRVSTAEPSGGGGVLVTSLGGLWRRDRDHVIVGGLSASEMPRMGSDDRLEGEAVRALMSALGLSHDADQDLRRERLVFYLAATAPTGSVALVRQGADDEGRALPESVFWDEFLDLYRMSGDDLPAEGRPHVEHVGPQDPEIDGAVRSTVRGSVWDSRVRASLAEIEAVAPGEIELYASCPYRWFIERRLRGRSSDVAVDVMTAGRAAHDALARFYREWIAERGDRVTPENVQDAMAMARVHSDAVLREAPSPATLEEKGLLAGVTAGVLALVARDAEFMAGYRPAEVEWSFGLGGDDPVDVGGVLIKGRADRIDVGPEGLVIIDYKRTHAASLAEIKRDHLVQLQLYAAAASARLGAPVAGGLYRSVSSTQDRGFAIPEIGRGLQARDVISADEIAGEIQEAVELARAAVEGMRAGRIAPEPLKERCAHCGATPFCSEAVRS